MINPKEKRNSYSSILNKMEYYCDGIKCSAEQISLRGMNFGQHWRTPNIKIFNYSVTLPKSFAIEYIDQEMSEYQKDAEKFPDPTDTFEVELKLQGWPTAINMLSIPKLSKLTLEYFGHELLLEWFGDGPPDMEPGFILNTIDEVSEVKDFILLNGKCRRSQSNIAYQDV